MGLKTKDANRKYLERHADSNPTLSTPRVRKHQEKLIVDFNFSSIRSKRAKVSKVSSVVSHAMEGLSPTSKVKSLNSCLTPNTKNTLTEKENDGAVMSLYQDLASCRDKISNCTRQLILS